MEPNERWGGCDDVGDDDDGCDDVGDDDDFIALMGYLRTRDGAIGVDIL